MSRSTYSLASFSYAWESTDTKLYHAVTDEDKKGELYNSCYS